MAIALFICGLLFIGMILWHIDGVQDRKKFEPRKDLIDPEIVRSLKSSPICETFPEMRTNNNILEVIICDEEDVLKCLLEEAVENENYELAASIRDEININQSKQNKTWE